MTKPPGTQVVLSAAAVRQGGRFLSPARYRHPGDVIRLIIAGLVLLVALAVTAFTHATYAGASAVAVTAVVPAMLAGRVLAGLVQVLFVGAAAAALIITLRYRRYRLLAGLAGGAAVAGAVLAGTIYLAGGERPRALTALAAAAPSPGGLGAIEAALIAGLTGVGMPAGPAVSAVLLHRLATYWLPVAPGWLSRRVQRREYV